jgi:hypothetical protein
LAAVARRVHALTSAEDLPGASDFEATKKPVGRAWVRRVGGRNLWLWYRFDANDVMLVALTTEPPLPFDDFSKTRGEFCGLAGTREKPRKR